MRRKTKHIYFININFQNQSKILPVDADIHFALKRFSVNYRVETINMLT